MSSLGGALAVPPWQAAAALEDEQQELISESVFPETALATLVEHLPRKVFSHPFVAMSGWAAAEPQRSSEVPGHRDVTAPTRTVPTSTPGASGPFLPALLVLFSLPCSHFSPCLAPLQQHFPLQSEPRCVPSHGRT